MYKLNIKNLNIYYNWLKRQSKIPDKYSYIIPTRTILNKIIYIKLTKNNPFKKKNLEIKKKGKK